VKATLHWVAAPHAVPAEVRLYDRLFSTPDTDTVPEGQAFLANLNPESLAVLSPCYVEPSLKDAPPGERYQFERLGYFAVDPDTGGGRPIFNRAVSLKDTWARIEAKG